MSAYLKIFLHNTKARVWCKRLKITNKMHTLLDPLLQNTHRRFTLTQNRCHTFISSRSGNPLATSITVTIALILLLISWKRNSQFKQSTHTLHENWTESRGRSEWSLIFARWSPILTTYWASAVLARTALPIRRYSADGGCLAKFPATSVHPPLGRELRSAGAFQWATERTLIVLPMMMITAWGTYIHSKLQPQSTETDRQVSEILGGLLCTWRSL